METYRKVIIVASIIAVLGIGFFSYIFFFQKTESPEDLQDAISQKAQPIETLTGEPAAPEDIDEAAPLNVPLQESDGPVRELVNGLSADPSFKKWLKVNDMIRRIVAVTANIAGGESPGNHLEFLSPKVDFQVLSKEGKYYMSPKSYLRYNHVAQAVSSFETEVVKRLYPQLEPLLQQAYNELGFPGKKFGDTLNRAFEVVLTTLIVMEDIELERKVISFAFKDQELEAMNLAQKHLFRMGPENMKKIKSKIRDIAVALDLPVARRRDLF